MLSCERAAGMCAQARARLRGRAPLALVMCVPMARCVPLHSRHMKQPRLKEAHFGALPLQSTQWRFSGSCSSAASCACSRVGGTGRFDIS